MRIDIGAAFEEAVRWMQDHLGPLLDAISTLLLAVTSGIEQALLAVPSAVFIPLVVLLAWRVASRGVALFALVGLLLLEDVELTLFGFPLAFGMDLWTLAMETLALVLTATACAFLVGIPLGIWAAKNAVVERVVRPILDFMQTLPAFVYLIPAVLLFGLGEVPGVIATFIFATPPCVRLTRLGIQQVPDEVVEAAEAFGSTPWQLLLKVELPMALPTILAGVNQTIMLALSMVVIAALIGAGGLGNPVVQGVTQLRTATGFEGGLAIVILAILLDRITQSVGQRAGTDAQAQG
jgi:glycine betaine/proline transport system permease protein